MSGDGKWYSNLLVVSQQRHNIDDLTQIEIQNLPISDFIIFLNISAFIIRIITLYKL